MKNINKGKIEPLLTFMKGIIRGRIDINILGNYIPTVVCNLATLPRFGIFV